MFLLAGAAVIAVLAISQLRKPAPRIYDPVEGTGYPVLDPEGIGA